MIVRGVVILATVCLAFAVPEARRQVTSAQSDDTAKALLDKEHELLDAVGKADKASMQTLLMPEGTWTTKDGFIPMKFLVERPEAFKLTKWDMVNPHVTSLGPESALVLYVWAGSGTLNNRPVAQTSLASTVWAKRNGQWLAVHHQETDLAK